MSTLKERQSYEGNLEVNSYYSFEEFESLEIDMCSDEESEYDVEKDRVVTDVNINKPLAYYLDQVNSEQLNLDRETEREYIKQFQLTGDTNARDMVIKNNLRFVVYMCKGKFTTWRDPLEFISVGNEALIRSIGAFDYTKGTDFRTYAGQSIKRAINKYISSLNGIELPDETMRLKFHVNKTINELQMLTSDTNITSEQIADILNKKGVKINRKEISTEDVEVVRKFDRLRSVNEIISQDTTSVELGDTFIDEESEPVFSQVENRAVLTKLLNRLSEQEKQVIYLRYFKDMTTEMVGARLGVSKQRANQIEKVAMTKMKRAAGVN